MINSKKHRRVKRLAGMTGAETQSYYKDVDNATVAFTAILSLSALVIEILALCIIYNPIPS